MLYTELGIGKHYYNVSLSNWTDDVYEWVGIYMPVDIYLLDPYSMKLNTVNVVRSCAWRCIMTPYDESSWDYSVHTYVIV